MEAGGAIANTQISGFWSKGPLLALGCLIGAIILLSWSKAPSLRPTSTISLLEPLDSIQLEDPFTPAEIQGNYIDSGQIIGWRLSASQYSTIRVLEQIIQGDTSFLGLIDLPQQLADLPLTGEEHKLWDGFLSGMSNESKQGDVQLKSADLIKKMRDRDQLQTALNRDIYEHDRLNDPSERSVLSIAISKQRLKLTEIEKQIVRLIRETDQPGSRPKRSTPSNQEKRALIASLDRMMQERGVVASSSGYFNPETLLRGHKVYLQASPYETFVLAKVSSLPPLALIDLHTNVRIPIQSVEDEGSRWLLRFDSNHLPIELSRNWSLETARDRPTGALLHPVFTWGRLKS
jgi:hypothetical protein